MEPQNGTLEDYFPLQTGDFQVHVSFRACMGKIYKDLLVVLISSASLRILKVRSDDGNS